MKKLLNVLVVLSVGVALGRLFDEPSPLAEALPPCQDINGDGSSNLTDAVFVLNWLFLGGPMPTCPAGNGQPAGLPDTGQSTCRNSMGEVIPCDSAACPGQDGAYATGCPSEGRFVDNGDGTVTDHCTGLMWQKDTADLNGDGKSTDEDSVRWCDALAYCENLSFAGHDDWRLPNVRELESNQDYGRAGPRIYRAFGVFASACGSYTPDAVFPGHAWLVNFGDGCVTGGDLDLLLYVRAVRSGP